MTTVTKFTTPPLPAPRSTLVPSGMMRRPRRLPEACASCSRPITQLAEAYAQSATMATKPAVPVPAPARLAQGRSQARSFTRGRWRSGNRTRALLTNGGEPGFSRRSGLESRLREELKMS